MEEARLRSGIRIDAERGVVFPGNVQASRHAHDICGAVRTALLTGRFIFRWLGLQNDPWPGLGAGLAFGVEGQNQSADCEAVAVGQ